MRAAGECFEMKKRKGFARMAGMGSASAGAVHYDGIGHRRAVVAEVFATLPVEALPSVGEPLAAALFGRAAGPRGAGRCFWRESGLLLAEVSMRCLKADRPGERLATAALTVLKCAGGLGLDRQPVPEPAHEDSGDWWTPSPAELARYPKWPMRTIYHRRGNRAASNGA